MGNVSDEDRQRIEADLLPLARRQESLSRRQQALLAAAGMDQPHREWFVVTVEPGQDGFVHAAMEASVIEHWMPARRKFRPRRGVRPAGVILLPALPGYIFVKVAANLDARQAVCGIKGVKGVLGNPDTGKPLPVRESDVIKLRAYLDDPDAHAVVNNTLRPGEQVLVSDGPFRMFQGTVVLMDDKAGRAKVDVQIFGRVVPVELEVGQVEKL